ncbi:hypothetical protein C2G38_2176644 [Gigaspora rosea]|uniref:Uncharacterized protein n=1 Tax=Gigaspora rosea TaxID=44941 RepID=A0A397VKA6_9GLOM|nr:hypothetical protein C2G38_2176644 [Gigaspora rosea]
MLCSVQSRKCGWALYQRERASVEKYKPKGFINYQKPADIGKKNKPRAYISPKILSIQFYKKGNEFKSCTRAQTNLIESEKESPEEKKDNNKKERVCGESLNSSDMVDEIFNTNKKYKRNNIAIEIVISSNKPDHGSNESDLGSCEPDLGSFEHDIGSNEPNLGSCEPDLGSFEHDLGSNEPDLGTYEPDLTQYGRV